MLRRCTAYLVGAIALALVSVGAASPPRALAAEADFRDKTITLIVSSNPGGGTDVISHLIGPVLAKYLPGNPTMTYKIMAAAGGTAGLNYFYSQVPPDGLTFFIGAGNQLSPVVLRRKQIVYDPTKLELIGGFANPSSFLLIKPDAANRLTDRSAKPVHMAVWDGTRSGDLIAMWGAEGLKWNISLVFGYRGTSAMVLAFQRGEAEMFSNNDLSVVGPIIKSGEADLAAQTGDRGSGKLGPSSTFPKAPLLDELMRGKLTGTARDAFVLWEEQSQIGKWFTLPPKTPEAYVKAYRAAFLKAAQDPAFKNKAATLISPDLQEMSPEDLRSLIRDMVDAKDASLKYLDDLPKKFRK